MRLLRISEVLKRFPVGKTTWWNGIRNGKFPKPVKMSARAVAWKEEDIDMLIEKLSAQVVPVVPPEVTA